MEQGPAITVPDQWLRLNLSDSEENMSFNGVGMNWIAENVEWLFSGIAVAIPIAIIGWLFFKPSGNKQIQKGGKDSTNFQAGGDLKVEGDLKVGGKKDDK